MKPLFAFIIILALCVQSHATRPYPPRVFADDSFTYIVGFAWPDQNGDVLMIRTMRQTSLFSLEELGISTMGEISTAGYQWYQNSIGYVARVKIKGEDPTSQQRIFYFRNKAGGEIAINLYSSEVIDLSTILDMETLKKHTISEAVKLLDSQNPKDRQTGAIHLGQLDASQHLQRLKELFNDDSYYTQMTADSTNQVYYVKEAAEKAVALIEGSIANHH